MKNQIENSFSVLNKNINDFNFSIRSIQALERTGIHTLSDIIAKERDFFSATNFFGPEVIVEIEEILSENGLTFKN
jgi:DNA-directed RNA polymerase alpha subunit